MSTRPLRARDIVLDHAVSRRAVRKFANEPKHKLAALIAIDGKTNSIPRSPLGQSRTTGGVSQVAEIFQFMMARDFTFVPGGTAATIPACAQGKPRRV
jgi:hypothetical protein